jgi:hypothetical protein
MRRRALVRSTRARPVLDHSSHQRETRAQAGRKGRTGDDRSASTPAHVLGAYGSGRCLRNARARTCQFGRNGATFCPRELPAQRGRGRGARDRQTDYARQDAHEGPRGRSTRSRRTVATSPGSRPTPAAASRSRSSRSPVGCSVDVGSSRGESCKVRGGTIGAIALTADGRVLWVGRIRQYGVRL